jgi:tetratricopeptide (TPR) repeat protein
MTEALVDYYALLGVARTASRPELERAIKQGIRTWSKQTARPELDKRQEAERKMEQLKQAREILLDDARRREYDQRLAAAPPPDGAATAAEPGDWLELARQALRMDDFRTAVRAAQEAQPTNERSAELWGIMARANAGLGRFDDAIFEARRALQLEPDNLDHRYTLANSFEQAGDWTNALRCYQDLAQLDPRSELPQIGTASVYLACGEPGRAVTLLEHLHANGQERALAGDYLAMALIRMAELVPQVQEHGRYCITSRAEIRQMRWLLGRARQVTQDPGLLADVADVRNYVDEMAGHEFVWRRLFGVWGRRYFAVSALFLCCFGAGMQLSEAFAAMFVMSALAVVTGAVGLVSYARVPRWVFNRANQTGRYLTY